MTFLDLVKERWSVRQYQDRPVEEEKIAKMLEAARHAPSAVNCQPTVVYILKSPEARAKTKNINFGAPLVFLIGYDTERVWWNPAEPGYNTGEQDASIVTTQMMLEAWELGLGSVWIRGFDSRRIVDEYQLPDHIVPVCMLSVGYAAEGAKPFRPWHDMNRKIEDFTEVL